MADQKTDYALIDSGDQQRLEQWGPYVTIRPEPTATWPKQPVPAWQTANAIYQGTTATNGRWLIKHPLPATWPITLGEWQFAVGLGQSKHLGLFPEQLEQWQTLANLIRSAKPKFPEPIRYLNLFGYTGAASIVATKAGAFTTHVDSSSPAIGRAQLNQSLNGLDPRSIRWIRDDVLTFVEREIRRNKTYDLISLDPPAFGHGAHGEQFSLRKNLTHLLSEVHKLLSMKALGVFVTVYSDDWTVAELTELCSTIFIDTAITGSTLQLTEATAGKALTTGIWAYIHTS